MRYCELCVFVYFCYFLMFLGIIVYVKCGVIDINLVCG